MKKVLIGVLGGLGVFGLTAVLASVLRGGGGATTRGNVYVRDRTIYGPGGFEYRITNNDLLWLARALWGEAGDRNTEGQAAVAWAMVQYHALVIGRGGRRPAFPTLSELLRRYCQPINPMWASMSARGCQRQPERCTRRHLQRRAMITNASWDDIPVAARRTAERLLRGGLPNPVPGAVDWAGRGVSWAHRSQTPLIVVGGNTFGVSDRRRIYREG